MATQGHLGSSLVAKNTKKIVISFFFALIELVFETTTRSKEAACFTLLLWL